MGSRLGRTQAKEVRSRAFVYTNLRSRWSREHQSSVVLGLIALHEEGQGLEFRKRGQLVFGCNNLATRIEPRAVPQRQ